MVGGFIYIKRLGPALTARIWAGMRRGPSVILRKPVLENLVTEQRNPASEHIDRLPTRELLKVINHEDQQVASAVEAEIPQVAAAVDGIVERFQLGGRLFYLGAGTSGRLGVLDASEYPPTFGVDPERVQGIIAGGATALLRSKEASEDRFEAAEEDLRSRDFARVDSLVAISASGRTPYALGGVSHARGLGALAVGLSSNPGSDLARRADIAITPLTGPEVITGSSRMKSGTAHKLVLNMISTAVMVRMGYVLGNLMVSVQPKSAKLLARGRRIVAEVTACGPEQAARSLEAAGNNVRLAIVMVKLGLDRPAAEQRLVQAGDHLGKALESAGEL